MRALIPGTPFEVNGKLYMLFRDGAFQCRRNTLEVRLPRIASLNWITLHRR